MTFLLRALSLEWVQAGVGHDVRAEGEKSLWGCMRITWQPRRGQMGRFERELM